MASEHGMTIEARSATYADAGMGGTAPKTKKPAAVKRATGKAGKGAPLRTIDLFKPQIAPELHRKKLEIFLKNFLTLFEKRVQ